HGRQQLHRKRAQFHGEEYCRAPPGEDALFRSLSAVFRRGTYSDLHSREPDLLSIASPNPSGLHGSVVRVAHLSEIESCRIATSEAAQERSNRVSRGSANQMELSPAIPALAGGEIEWLSKCTLHDCGGEIDPEFV